MAFGMLGGMPAVQPPQIQPNQMMQMGMQAMQGARGMQSGQQGLLQRLLNPPTPPGGAPPTTTGGAMGSGDPSQMGMLSKLFPGLFGGPQMTPGMQQQMPGMPPQAGALNPQMMPAMQQQPQMMPFMGAGSGG